MPGRELCWRDAPEPTVRSRLVVIATPCSDQGSRVLEVDEVVVVEAFVAKFAVEALDVGVLRRFAGGNQFEIDAAAIRPPIQRPACEFRPLVGANRARQPA